jgi:UDPglucose 6-dehydrogenase
MRVGVIGSGYVGLVTGACLAHLNHDVICVDNNSKKINTLRKGHLPIYEPGLQEIIKASVRRRKLKFSTQIRDAVEQSEILFICVSTPPKDDGNADLSHVESVAREIARHLKSYRLVVEKSTVPVETGQWIHRTIRSITADETLFDVASNPEFLREGSAVHDFLHPDRIVIGAASKKAESLMRQLYEPLKSRILVTDLKSAELIKHASNSFLATKISFINAVARICDAAGADVEKVALGMGLDPRIGRSFLKAGVAFGGFCFPKDLSSFLHLSEKLGQRFVDI